MAEEAAEAPAEEQDQPTEAPPEGTSATQEEEQSFFDEKFDPSTLPEELQQRYREMHGDYTRKTQGVAEERKQLQEQRQEAEAAVGWIQALQDPNQQAQALQQLAEAIGPEAVLDALGLEVAGGEEDQYQQEGETEQEHLQRLAYLEQREAERAEMEQAREEEAFLEQVQEQIDTEIKTASEKEGVNLNDKVHEWIFDRTIVLGPGPNGPQVEQAVQDFKALGDDMIKSYRSSKPRPGGAPPNRGSSGVPQSDLSDQKSRLAAANDAAQRAMDSFG